MLISHFGTFDVNNYGDLLFPLLLRKRAEKMQKCELEFASPVGGSPVLKDSINSVCVTDVFRRDRPFDAAIVGGGNIIHMMPSTLADYRVAERGLIGYPDLWLGVSLNAPANVPVVWNAPGVPCPFEDEHYELVQRAIERINYLSVRDEVSRRHLLDVCPEADIAVVPDSAWSICDVWPIDKLTAVYEKIFHSKSIKTPERTVVFHLNKRYIGSLSLKEVAGRLDHIAATLQARPILLSIGVCHGDDELAKNLAVEMDSSPVLVDQPKSLVEVAAYLSHSVAYFGSSMHGFITASAYSIPAVCIANTEMVKFKGLIEFMSNPNVVVNSWSELADSIATFDYRSHQNDLIDVHARARMEINAHWKRIEKEFFEKQVGVNQGVHNAFVRQEDYLKYKSEVLVSTLKIFTRVNRKTEKQLVATKKKLVKTDEAVVDLRGGISKLKVQMDLYQNSLSWKLTKPLRYLSARNPRLAKIVSRVLRECNRVVKKKVIHAHVKMKKYDWGPPSDIGKKIKDYKKNITAGQRKVAVFTALYGGYDTLMLPDCLESDVDYVCFTDGPVNSFGVWKVRSAPYYHPDSTRIARYVKTHPHELLPNYDVVVWIDSNIVIRGDIWKYIKILKENKADISFVTHPLRDCVYDEAEACKKLNKDQGEVIDKQIERYQQKKYPPNSGMHETNIFVVNLNATDVQMFFRSWWKEIDLYSKRDQLSVGWVLSNSKINKTQLMPNDVSVRNNADFTIYPHEIARSLSLPKQLKRFTSIEEPDISVRFTDVRDPRLTPIKDISIGIVICVYNALEDVKLCLSSVINHLSDNENIILVNDVSNDETTEYLRRFSKDNNRVTLVENEKNIGYTKSANRGLRVCKSDFRIMLNSDTIVSKNWAQKMANVAYSNEAIGIVGPLSNAASWQSIPEIKGSRGQTAINKLPKNIKISDIDLVCEKWASADFFPRVPLIHGFCFGIKGSVIERIGYFDDVNFKRYYGEENDYCFRARSAGFEFAIATNTFVYHRKSRSIEKELRLVHMDKAGKRLREIYGAKNVALACQQMADHPLLVQLRSQAAQYFNA